MSHPHSSSLGPIIQGGRSLPGHFSNLGALLPGCSPGAPGAMGTAQCPYKPQDTAPSCCGLPTSWGCMSGPSHSLLLLLGHQESLPHVTWLGLVTARPALRSPEQQRTVLGMTPLRQDPLPGLSGQHHPRGRGTWAWRTSRTSTLSTFSGCSRAPSHPPDLRTLSSPTCVLRAPHPGRLCTWG